jgi:uncharacterized membrane protein YkoI
MMDIKAMVFSALALAGTAGLLWTGFTAVDPEQGEQSEQHEEQHEHESGQAAVGANQQAGDILTLEQILELARQQHPGRVLETELERKGERYIYEVELLDDSGEVWEMKFDASTGKLLKEEQED